MLAPSCSTSLGPDDGTNDPIAWPMASKHGQLLGQGAGLASECLECVNKVNTPKQQTKPGNPPNCPGHPIHAQSIRVAYITNDT